MGFSAVKSGVKDEWPIMKFDFMKRHLSQDEVRVFYLVASFLYVLPFMLSDYLYIDDSLRATFARANLAYEGRVLADVIYKVLSFSHAAPNMFPLALLLTTTGLALALARLSRHYFPDLTYSHCLVVLPLLYCPFFLQNLSYQYDGPAMILSIVASILAVTYQEQGVWKRWVVPALLVAVLLAFYQPAINVFVGLCCIEVFRLLERGEPLEKIFKAAGNKLLQLWAGVGVYYLTAYPLMGDNRNQLIRFDASTVSEIGSRILLFFKMVPHVFSGGGSWLLLCLLGLAVAGYCYVIIKMLSSNIRVSEKLTRLFLQGVLLGVLCLSIHGIMLLLAYFNLGFRTLVGASVLLLFLFYLSFSALTRCHPQAGILLAVPLLYMLSFSYAYGRALLMKQEMEKTVSFNLSYDISSRAALRQVKKFYLLGDRVYDWVPANQGTRAVMPGVHEIMGLGFVVYPDALVSVGIDNVQWADESYFTQDKIDALGVPLVNNKYYDIYLIGQEGFIRMKQNNRQDDRAGTQ